MSKDKGGKNIKKTRAAEGKKLVSDYQAGKKITPKDDISIISKKK